MSWERQLHAVLGRPRLQLPKDLSEYLSTYLLSKKYDEIKFEMLRTILRKWVQDNGVLGI